MYFWELQCCTSVLQVCVSLLSLFFSYAAHTPPSSDKTGVVYLLQPPHKNSPNQHRHFVFSFRLQILKKIRFTTRWRPKLLCHMTGKVLFKVFSFHKNGVDLESPGHMTGKIFRTETTTEYIHKIVIFFHWSCDSKPKLSNFGAFNKILLLRVNISLSFILESYFMYVDSFHSFQYFLENTNVRL